jgi:hypothetical protein
MPSAQLKEEKVQELAALVQGWGKILAGEAYGPEGPGWDVDLATLEALAVTMPQALRQGLCEELTQRQAERLPPAQPGPTCGGECQVQPPDDAPQTRRLQLRGGGFE